MIKTSYDPDADAFAAWFAADGATVDHTDEVAPGVFIDFDAAGNAIGIEVIEIRRRLASAPVKHERQAAAE
jgi:uncharacterized protein YuzE